MPKWLAKTVLVSIVALCVTVVPVAEQLVAAQAEQSALEDKLELTKAFFASSLDTENLAVPFDDLFTPNECKRVLVFSLRKKRDQIGSAIRKAVINPNVTIQDVRKMIIAWEITSAEVSFARNIEQLAHEKTANNLIGKVNTLYPNNHLLKAKSAQWPEQYASEFERVKNCNPGWSGITKKWEAFKKNVIEAANNLKQAILDVKEEGNGLVSHIIDNPLDALTPLDEAGLDALYKDDKDFDFGRYLQTDFDKNNVWSTTYTESSKSIKELQGLDPVQLQVQLNGENLRLDQLASQSLGSTDQIYNAINDILKAAKADIQYGYVDGVINAVLAESEQTQQTFAGVSVVLKEELNPILADITARQCQIAE